MLFRSADTSENEGSFFDFKSGIYKVQGLDEYEEEKEVLGIDKVKVFKISWVRNDV